LHIIDELLARPEVNSVRVFDSVVSKSDLMGLPQNVQVADDFDQACESVDAVIIANNHPYFSTIDLESCIARMNSGGFLYDYWNNLGEQPSEVLEGRYFVVGNLVGAF